MSTFLSVVQSLQPRTAIVLGSGLGSIPRSFHARAALPFREVPGLVETTIAGHSGRMEVGVCVDQPIVVFHGRLHYYEGHSWERVARPVEFAAEMGIRNLILTNAAGGIRDDLHPGSLMLIRNHLSLQRTNYWRNLSTDRASPYSSRLLAMFQEAAESPVLAGIYAAVTGPCYETPAEIRALRACGADAVGMSTAHEVETAHRIGLECAAISCITNRAAGLTQAPLNHLEVLQEAARQANRLSNWIEAVLPKLSR